MSTTFSLLQISLDQTIERDFFVDAARATEAVTRLDLSQLYRDLYGIAASHLSHADALALQREWARMDFPTEIVADEDLPMLPDEYQVQRVEVDGEFLRFTDAMGRDDRRPVSDLVFSAGGFVMNSKETSERQIAFSPLPRVGHPHRPEFRNPEIKRIYGSEDAGAFRLDFFFWAEPNRLVMSLSEETTFFIQGKACRFHRKAELMEMVETLGRLVPQERRSTGMNGNTRPYPSRRAYFEEIRWHFYRLIKAG